MPEPEPPSPAPGPLSPSRVQKERDEAGDFYDHDAEMLLFKVWTLLLIFLTCAGVLALAAILGWLW